MTKMKNLFWSISFFLLLLTSCEAPYNVDLKQAEIKLAVRASVVTGAGPHYVDLTKSMAYTDNSTPTAVTGAVVTISDDGGQNELLTEAMPGHYVTSTLMGIAGRTYTLTINTNDGKVFKSTEKMETVPPIDSITYKYLDKAVGVSEAGYYMSMYAVDPPNTKNYYRVKMKGNNKIENPKLSEMLVAEDKFANGSNIGVAFFDPYKVNIGETITIQLLSLTKTQYEYYRDVVDQAQSGGSPFSAPAINPKGNISNGALGIFNVSDVSSKSKLIQ